MSKEAIKLALEALENSRSLEPVDVQWVKGKRHAAITALREALAEQPAQQEFVSPGGGYVPAIPAQQRPIKTFHDGKAWPVQEPAQQDSTCNNALRIQGKAYPRTCKKCGLGPCVELAQQALDKKTENARELGLDYEPAQQGPVAWKLVPKEPTHEMLKAMDECSTEGYDERLYAGHASSVYMAAVDAAPTPPAQQEPVAWVCYGSNNKHDIDFFEDEIADLAVGTKLYTHAQRTWVGLTDEEADELVQRFARYELLRAIEAKLKEKNNG